MKNMIRYKSPSPRTRTGPLVSGPVLDCLCGITAVTAIFNYRAAAWRSSFLMALLMKSLMVEPDAATNAATRE